MKPWHVYVICALTYIFLLSYTSFGIGFKKGYHKGYWQGIEDQAYEDYDGRLDVQTEKTG